MWANVIFDCPWSEEFWLRFGDKEVSTRERSFAKGIGLGLHVLVFVVNSCLFPFGVSFDAGNECYDNKKVEDQ